MNFTRCIKCKEYHWDTDVCDPIYKVFEPDYLGDEYKEIRASSLECAAEKYGLYRSDDGAFEGEINIEDPQGETVTVILSPTYELHFELSYPKRKH